MKPINNFLFLFLFQLTTTFFPSLITTTTTTSIDSLQIQTLLTFKSSLKNPNLLPNWSPRNNNNNPCTFTGVSCKSNNSISSLDLSGKDLSCDVGLISSTLLTLPFLESFTANNCNLTGVISFPPGSKCSGALASLDLGGNRISGSVSDLSSLVVCPEIKSVRLSRNLLEFDNSGLLEPIGVSLRVLDLSNNRVSGSGLVPWIVSDGCGSLVEFNVSGNNISGSVPEGLRSCESLEVFDISKNNFSGELPMDTLSGLGGLKTLVLGFNNFDGELPGFLPSKLEKFDVSSNRISGGIPTDLCGGGGTSRLKVLYLQNNRLNGSIPSGLSNCSELVSLDLSFNSLTGEIPSSFRYLSKLQDLIIWMNLLTGGIPEELTYVKTLENLILDFNYLTGSIPSSLSNCTNLNWISLSNNKLDGEIPATLGGLPNLAILKLGNNSFSGKIPAELGNCKSLVWLDLNTNELSGTIPPDLFKQSGYIAARYLTGKPFIYIKNDGSKAQCHGAGNLLEFGGIRQDDLDRISSRHPCNFTRLYLGVTQPNFNHNGSMIFFDLSYNKLEGGIPKELGSMYYLNILNLGHNDLSGPIPEELSGLKNVAILDLSHNRLNGTIPNSLTSLSLGDADLSFNNLTGSIPESAPFDTFGEDRFWNNSGLCGYPLPLCPKDPRARSNGRKQSNRREASLAGSVAMGLLFSLFCIFGVIIILIEMRKRRRKKAATALEAYVDTGGNSYSGGGGNASTAWKLTSTREALSISLAAFEKPLRKLTFADLLEATNGFDDKSLVGSGGFGDVYRAQLKDNTVVAIKKLIHVSGQGDREFMAEMETIGRVKHRNLVPLLGYCKVGDERLLVYEYMKFGSLEDVLHDRKKTGIKLNWATRRKIAIGSARGLAFLHHNCIPHIIHRDMKSSNVLLDENLEARVSDFGMARHMSAMETHLSVSTLSGTPGYVPPEYYQSFQCSTRGDVYSYGVVLLELLTGKRPTDSPDFGDNNLVGWVKQHAKTRITDVFDRELLREDPGLEFELLQHLKVACRCLDERHLQRPTMIQVMAMFKEIQAGSGLDSVAAVAGGRAHFSTAEGVEMTIIEEK